MPARMDHVADVNGVELNRLWQLYAFPDFVKKADMEQTFRPSRFTTITAYADPVRHQFPCHNAASTWLSVLYFTEKKAEFHPKDQTHIEARLKHYTTYWRIEPDVQQLLVKHASYQRAQDAALPDSVYAYVHVNQDTGHKLRHLPMRNAQETKAAADYLETYRDRFQFTERHGMAKRILEKAAKFGAAVSNREFLEKQAGMGVCNPDRVVTMLKDRAMLATLPALRDQLVKLANTVAGQPRQAFAPAMLVELASTIDTVDRSLGLYGHYAECFSAPDHSSGAYTDKIPRPEDVLFEATFTKAAGDLASVCALTSGKVYKKADFSKLDLGTVESLFGSDFANEVRRGVNNVDEEKLAELVSTLPRPDAELFDRMMEDASLRPVLHKAASAKVGFSDADFVELAKMYTAS